MRWLGILAIAVVAAAIYLYSSLSGGATVVRRDHPAKAKPEVATEEVAEAAPAAKPEAPIKVTPPPPVQPQPNPIAKTSPGERPAMGAASADLPADASQEEVPWTEPERQQWLWTANGRFEKGNYPGAVEASLEIARRNPGTAWEQDAWRVTIKSYCAMSEPDKANALFAKMTDQTGIDEVLKGCAEWNVQLAKK